MQKTVTVTIDEMGNPKVEAHNFQGQGCADATAALEQALAGGSGGVSREYKPEWTAQGGSNQTRIKQSW